MKLLKLKDKKVADRLQERLLRKRKVVAIVEKEEDLKKVKRADVVLLVEKERTEEALQKHATTPKFLYNVYP